MGYAEGCRLGAPSFNLQSCTRVRGSFRSCVFRRVELTAPKGYSDVYIKATLEYFGNINLECRALGSRYAEPGQELAPPRQNLVKLLDSWNFLGGYRHPCTRTQVIATLRTVPISERLIQRIASSCYSRAKTGRSRGGSLAGGHAGNTTPWRQFGQAAGDHL